MVPGPAAFYASSMPVRRQEKELEARFRALVENTSDPIALLGPDGRVAYVSPAITAMLGHQPAELTGKLGFAFLDPRDRKRMRTLFALAIWEGPVPVRAEVRGRHADGSWRELEVSLVSGLDDPTVDAMVVTFKVREVPEG